MGIADETGTALNCPNTKLAHARAGFQCGGSSAEFERRDAGFSVLTDAGVEHYRGSFQNRAMYVPLVSAALTLGASLFGITDSGSSRHGLRDTVYALAATTGLVGLGFHAYNIAKRPGSLS